MAPRMTGLLVRDLCIQRGGRRLLQDVTFSADPGQLLALVGVSGTGKTSLLRAIGGLDEITAGEIQLGDVRLDRGSRRGTHRALHRAVGMVFQFHHLFSNMTAAQNVWLAPVHVLGHARDDAERNARRLLETLGVGGRADALPHELSGGEAQRVAIARALAVDPHVLLLDEPTASLDQGRRAELGTTLLHLARQGRTIVIASHELEFVRACAHRAVVLENGRIVADGPATQVLAPS
jgi:polar amino acid transport system ATP-binding protein